MDDPEVKDEAARIRQEVLITACDLAETKYYGHIAGLFRDDLEFRRHLDRVLGPDPEPVLMVIYALGSPELNHNSQYQLALVILLKRDFPDRIGDIELYDPAFLLVDRLALETLGLQVLPTNEHFPRPADKPTLFFLPSANIWHVGNLLEANWCTSRVNRMMILSNSLYAGNPDTEVADRCWHHQVYSGILKKYARRFDIPTNFHGYLRYIFGYLSFSFFDVDPIVDLDSLLPGDEFGQMHGYRFPGPHRCEWQPPPEGWLKLNFSGKACDGVSPAGCGGILRDEYEDVVATYSCRLGELADATVANAEALRMGMRLLEDVPGGVKQLVVEGTDLSVVRWACSGPEPPEKVTEAVDDILDAVGRIKTVIYHVYEEANEAAIALAKEGTTLQDRLV
ncbi:hypothetical protein BT93_L1915 [Corymbia citriodora subsp. variegata]|uniref:SRR1-like domain-containing protein n=1 Tax=Corymbia citriodora subsp. variegata TaxID=360336 RepID=A0A8T0CQX7_CORYI|nr:hypothetical protein BT93_L1915 [Corymbia citriodora subsp. variegata]